MVSGGERAGTIVTPTLAPSSYNRARASLPANDGPLHSRIFVFSALDFAVPGQKKPAGMRRRLLVSSQFRSGIAPVSVMIDGGCRLSSASWTGLD